MRARARLRPIDGDTHRRSEELNAPRVGGVASRDEHLHSIHVLRRRVGRRQVVVPQTRVHDLATRAGGEELRLGRGIAAQERLAIPARRFGPGVCIAQRTIQFLRREEREARHEVDRHREPAVLRRSVRRQVRPLEARVVVTLERPPHVDDARYFAMQRRALRNCLREGRKRRRGARGGAIEAETSERRRDDMRLPSTPLTCAPWKEAIPPPPCRHGPSSPRRAGLTGPSRGPRARHPAPG